MNRQNLNNELQQQYPDYFDGQDPLRQIDRREKPAERKTFEVAKIWEQHEEIIRRLLVGQKASTIAEEMNVSRAMVSYVRKSRVVQDRLEELKAERDKISVDTARYIKDQVPKALRLLEQIMDGDLDAPVHLRAKEANNWLDRAGFAPVRTLNTQNVHAHFTAEEIDDIKRRAVENGFARKSPLNEHLLVDVTPTGEQGRFASEVRKSEHALANEQGGTEGS
jgi:predicted transcriptional regulator